MDRDITQILKAPIIGDNEIIIGMINDYIHELNETIRDFRDNIEEADMVAINLYINGLPKFITDEPNIGDINFVWNWDESEMSQLTSKLNESKLIWDEFIRTYREVKKLDLLQSMRDGIAYFRTVLVSRKTSDWHTVKQQIRKVSDRNG